MISTLAALLRHHIATEAAPLPPASPGITWVWGGDGIYKRGVNAEVSILVPVAPTPPVPGLARLLPTLAYTRWRRRIPGQILVALLAHARRVCRQPSGLLLAREQQYLVTHEDGVLHARVPPQDATAARIRYAPGDAPILIDLHSHHQMGAYFSPIDDADDTGLGVSAVIGRIFDDHPEIALRLCCYGHRCRVPAGLAFDHLGPFRDTYQGDHDADAHD
jgi:PRTRC genetic system protein A